MTNPDSRAGLENEIKTLNAQSNVDRAVIDQLLAEGEVDKAKIANLETALITCRRIGAAMGVLMALRKITEDEAFDLLREVSKQQHRKLRLIADDVVRTGTL